ncbi:hypothetical protein FRC09_004872 [Ceratobasidium sp. 395]|nr:hypothetical protein FRC09_004872 [Ceratobasidium sp. 395]
MNTPANTPSLCQIVFPNPELDVEVDIVQPRDLRLKILDDRDAVDHIDNVYVSRIQYCKMPTGTAQHEFLMIHIRDKTDPARKNVMTLDRVPRDEDSPSKAKSVHEESGVGSTDRKFHWEFSLTSKPAMPNSSRYFLGSVHAFDRFAISKNNDPTSLCSSQGFTAYHELESLEIDHQDLTLGKLIFLAETVSAHQPNYKLFGAECYWYAGVTWEIACALAAPAERQPERHKLRGKAAYLTRHVAFKPPLADKSARPEAVRAIFDRNLPGFVASVKSRQGYGSASMTAQLQVRDQEVQVQGEEIRVRDEVIRARDEVIHARDEAIRARDEVIRAQDEEIQTLKQLLEKGRAVDV